MTIAPPYTPPQRIVDAIAAAGWRLVSHRPELVGVGCVRWRATIACGDDGPSVSLSAADPTGLLEELLRMAQARPAWKTRAVKAWRAHVAAQQARHDADPHVSREREERAELERREMGRLPEHLRTAALWMGERGESGWFELPERALAELAHKEQARAEESGRVVPAEAIAALARWMTEETLP